MSLYFIYINKNLTFLSVKFCELPTHFAYFSVDFFEHSLGGGVHIFWTQLVSFMSSKYFVPICGTPFTGYIMSLVT